MIEIIADGIRVLTTYGIDIPEELIQERARNIAQVLLVEETPDTITRS